MYQEYIRDNSIVLVLYIVDNSNSIHALLKNIKSITMPMRDMLLRHFRKMLSLVSIRGYTLLSLMYSNMYVYCGWTHPILVCTNCF